MFKLIISKNDVSLSCAIYPSVPYKGMRFFSHAINTIMASKTVLKQLKTTRPKQYAKDLGITRERLDDLPPTPLTPEEIENGKKPRQPIASFRYYYVATGADVPVDVLERIQKLGIPPAYRMVWISTDASTHLQATAKDDKNRTQYRYHTVHTLAQDHKKYARVIAFMKVLPTFTDKVEQDSRKPGLGKLKVIAWMFKIMQELNIRIGNDCYAKDNNSYGLSTLEKHHISFKELKTGKVAVFSFLGKSKQRHSLKLESPDAVKVVEQLFTLGNDHLFQFKEGGVLARVKADDLNEYLHRIMGNQFSCKDFRTYAANKFFLQFVRKETLAHPPDTIKQQKINLRNALDKAASKLGHKPSIAKKSYVKYLSDMYMDNPDRFANKKNINQLLTELFTLAIKENKQTVAGTWYPVVFANNVF